MLVISSSAAKKMQVDSLFKSGGTLSKEKYCTGKYSNNMLGRDLQVTNDKVKALFTERRKDSDGVYFSLYCMRQN